MGLEEQFMEATRYEYQEYAGSHPSTWEMDGEDLIKCVQIAENFAIGFSEWLFNDTKSDIKELLEIYKKTL